MAHLTWLTAKDLAFPSADHAMEEPNGLLAAGGDLSVPRLITAYRHGIFPWYAPGQPILWWCPDPRTVLWPNGLHVSRSMRKLIRQQRMRVTLDQDFSSVIRACAEPRHYADGTWITPQMQQAYIDLHRAGIAHSVEVWQDGLLVGGLYGVALGKVFFGESMFSDDTNASKAAMFALCSILIANNFVLLDCQVDSPHVLRMGAEMIPRQQMLKILKTACTSIMPFDTWPSETLAITDFNH